MAQKTVYTYVKEFKAGDIIFREGDKSASMFEVQKGKVDLYKDYGKPGQKKLAEVGAERFFGEMGMVEGLPRTATAVVQRDFTVVAEVTWEVFGLYFKTKPARVVQIMQQMGDRLRVTTQAAMDLKKIVDKSIEVIQDGGSTTDVIGLLQDGRQEMDKRLEENK